MTTIPLIDASILATRVYDASLNAGHTAAQAQCAADKEVDRLKAIDPLLEFEALGCIPRREAKIPVQDRPELYGLRMFISNTASPPRRTKAPKPHVGLGSEDSIIKRELELAAPPAGLAKCPMCFKHVEDGTRCCGGWVFM